MLSSIVNTGHRIKTTKLYSNRQSRQYQDAKQVQNNSMFIKNFPEFYLDIAEIIENGKEEMINIIKQNKEKQTANNNKDMNKEQNNKDNTNKE
jgi:hypothetical protein